MMVDFEGIEDGQRLCIATQLDNINRNQVWQGEGKSEPPSKSVFVSWANFILKMKKPSPTKSNKRGVKVSSLRLGLGSTFKSQILEDICKIA